MSNGDWDVPPNTVTFPPFATPGTPRYVIGPDVPPELETYVNTNFSQHCYFALLAYDSIGGYLFRAYCFSDAIQLSQEISGYMDSTLTGHLFTVQGWDVFGGSGFTSYGFGVGALAGSPVFVWSDWFYDGRSSPRSFVLQDYETVNVGPFVAEDVAFTFPSFTWRAGRSYEVTINASMFGTCPTAFYHARRTNLAGVEIWAGGLHFVNSSAIRYSANDSFTVMNATVADITRVLVITVQPFGGGDVNLEGQVMVPRFARVRDIGSASDITGVQI